MNFKDIIELAKQGYKPNDIKELLNLQVPDTPPGEGEQKTPETPPANDKPEGGNGAIDNSTNINNDDKPGTDSNDVDALKAEIEELKKSLKDAQANNSSKDNSGKKPEDPDKSIADWARSFM